MQGQRSKRRVQRPKLQLLRLKLHTLHGSCLWLCSSSHIVTPRILPQLELELVMMITVTMMMPVIMTPAMVITMMTTLRTRAKDSRTRSNASLDRHHDDGVVIRQRESVTLCASSSRFKLRLCS